MDPDPDLDSGFWILDSGFWILDSGFWILDSGFWILDYSGGDLERGTSAGLGLASALDGRDYFRPLQSFTR
jgi:hypothetical protein